MSFTKMLRDSLMPTAGITYIDLMVNATELAAIAIEDL
jgi:hypothetical protein